MDVERRVDRLSIWIRLEPETSILGLEVGDEIRLTEADFRRLADGFLAEIERRY